MQELQEHQQSTFPKLLSLSPDEFGEFVEQRVEATKQVSYAIKEIVSKQGILTPVEGARAIAAAVSYGVWGLDELIASASPGPAFGATEIVGSRQGMLAGRT